MESKEISELFVLSIHNYGFTWIHLSSTKVIKLIFMCRRMISTQKIVGLRLSGHDVTESV